MTNTKPELRYQRMLNRALLLALVSVLSGTSAQLAVAQGWPEKPVRVVVANATGSLSDTLARLIFTRTGEALPSTVPRLVHAAALVSKPT